MRIITVNLPKEFIEAIDCLTGRNGLYPSRSELIRVAVRDWLLKEIADAKAFEQYLPEPEPIRDPNKVYLGDGTVFTLKARVVSP